MENVIGGGGALGPLGGHPEDERVWGGGSYAWNGPRPT